MTRQEQELRRQRREFKRKQREERRREYRDRKQRRENVRNGGPIMVKPDTEFCNYEALRNYHPWAFCEICRRWVRQNLMHDENSCELCHSEKENESTDKQQSEGTESVPEGARGRAPFDAGLGKCEKAQLRRQAGQLVLGI